MDGSRRLGCRGPGRAGMGGGLGDFLRSLLAVCRRLGGLGCGLLAGRSLLGCGRLGGSLGSGVRGPASTLQRAPELGRGVLVHGAQGVGERKSGAFAPGQELLGRQPEVLGKGIQPDLRRHDVLEILFLLRPASGPHRTSSRHGRLSSFGWTRSTPPAAAVPRRRRGTPRLLFHSRR